MAAALLALVLVKTIATRPLLFDQLAQVRFINSGTVHSTDTFLWGVTTSGRNATATAANLKAGYVVVALSVDAGWVEV
jgi:hypothetical protein